MFTSYTLQRLLCKPNGISANRSSKLAPSGTKCVNVVISSAMLHGGRLQNAVTLSRLYHRDAVSSTGQRRQNGTGAEARRRKLVGAIFLDVARAFVTNGPREFSESSFLLATGGELLLINRVSSAVRYIHYLAPAAHLFRRPIYLSIYSRRRLGTSRPRILTRGCENAELINVSSKRGRPAAPTLFL